MVHYELDILMGGYVIKMYFKFKSKDGLGWC